MQGAWLLLCAAAFSALVGACFLIGATIEGRIVPYWRGLPLTPLSAPGWVIVVGFFGCDVLHALGVRWLSRRYGRARLTCRGVSLDYQVPRARVFLRYDELEGFEELEEGVLLRPASSSAFARWRAPLVVPTSGPEQAGQVLQVLEERRAEGPPPAREGATSFGPRAQPGSFYLLPLVYLGLLAALFWTDAPLLGAAIGVVAIQLHALCWGLLWWLRRAQPYRTRLEEGRLRHGHWSWDPGDTTIVEEAGPWLTLRREEGLALRLWLDDPAQRAALRAALPPGVKWLASSESPAGTSASSAGTPANSTGTWDRAATGERLPWRSALVALACVWLLIASGMLA